MTLVADSNGTVLGKFPIPANVPAGTKSVSFVGAGGSKADASFVGEGTLIENIRTAVTQITVTRWQQQVFVDPIAQTFTLNAPMQIEGIDIWFTALGTTTVSVQIRETQVGFPTQTVLADARLNPADITTGGWTRFNFPAPASMEAGVEYALVVLCNDAVSELAVAELGKFDAAAQQWVTSQPYTVGVLLNSSNASTWTAYQDRDLAFRIAARSYTEADRLIDLGSVEVVNATELLTLSLIESPTSSATGELELTMPNGSVIKAGDNQRIAFDALTTGTVGVKARLRADQYSSAALYPGTQIIQGNALMSSTYVSRAIDADATGATVKVIFDAIIPSGAGVTPEVSGVDGGDTYLSMTPVGTPKLIDGDIGLYEYQFQRAAVMEAMVRTRLTLTGTPAARPRVRNLRVIVL